MPAHFQDDDRIDQLLSLTEQGKPLTKVCVIPGMPGRSSVYEWIDPQHERYDAEFAGRFHDARARGIHALAEECLEIADEKPQEGFEVQDKRLRIDTRLRLAGKWLPSIYGDKIAVGGASDLPPVQTSVDWSLVPSEAIAAVVAAAKAK